MSKLSIVRSCAADSVDAEGTSRFSSANSGAPIGRWLAVVGLLGLELVAIGVLFDGEVLFTEPGKWARFVREAPQVVRLCIASAAAVLLIGRRQLLSRFVAVYRESGKDHRWRWSLCGHLLGLAAFVAVTAVLFGERRPLAYGTAWALLWGALAAATMALAALTVLPASAWRRITFECRGTLALAVPLGILAWRGSLSIGEFGWNALGRLTLKLVYFALSAVDAGVVYEPDEAVVGTSSFNVVVAPACAGYEGIGLTTIFLAGYLWLSRKQLRFPRALVLLPIGVVLIWFANVLRIVLLILIGSSGWPEVARGGFHSQAGWLAFNGIALGVVALAGRVGWIADRPAPRRVAVATDPTTAYLMPFLGIVTAAMATGALSPGFDWLYGIRVIVGAGLLAYYWPAYRDLRWEWTWQPLLFGLAAFLVWWALVPVPTAIGPPEQLASATRGWAMTWLCLRTAGYVLTAPLAEELAFRGFLLRRFVSPEFESVSLARFHWLGFLGSSLLFGLMHGRQCVPATVAGMLFAWAACRRGNLLDAIVAHATTNAIIALYVFTTGAWYLWG